MSLRKFIWRSRVAQHVIGLCLPGFLFVYSYHVYAAEPLSISVTPPLFQLTIGPGEFWSSSLKVVNSNTYPVSYYAQVVNFEPEGENGAGKFTPLVNVADDPAQRSFSLASWVTISDEPVLVPAGGSAEIPFSVKIPDDAEPGGHYGSILVGTKPSTETVQGPSMKIATLVSSLLLVRITGDLDERGRIREFFSDSSLYQTPRADFILRFENMGNVHLRPQGDIVLYNMWGKERGRLVINQNGNFGNVLPKSIRKFNFSWEGEESLFDIGRYSAEVTLAFGEKGKQNVTAVTYFWVVPLVPAGITLSVIILFLLMMTWFIRRYIKRALDLERERFGAHKPQGAPVATVYSVETLMEPLREGAIDLRSMTLGASKSKSGAHHGDLQRIQGGSSEQGRQTGISRRMTLGAFLAKYRIFFMFLLVLLVTLGGLAWYLDKVLVSERSFKIVDVKAE